MGFSIKQTHWWVIISQWSLTYHIILQWSLTPVPWARYHKFWFLFLHSYIEYMSTVAFHCLPLFFSKLSLFTFVRFIFWSKQESRIQRKKEKNNNYASQRAKLLNPYWNLTKEKLWVTALYVQQVVIGQTTSLIIIKTKVHSEEEKMEGKWIGVK